MAEAIPGSLRSGAPKSPQASSPSEGLPRPSAFFAGAPEVRAVGDDALVVDDAGFDDAGFDDTGFCDKDEAGEAVRLATLEFGLCAAFSSGLIGAAAEITNLVPQALHLPVLPTAEPGALSCLPQLAQVIAM